MPAGAPGGAGLVGFDSCQRWFGGASARFGIPLAAYVAIGLLLVGGIALLPWGVAWLLQRLQPLAARHPLTLLALERARRMRGTAAIAVGGVVASLSLAVALTVMVASFRGSVIQWLDAVLPSPLYVRSALQAAGATPPAAPGFAEAVARLPGCGQGIALRTSPATERRPPCPHRAQPPAGRRPAQVLPLTGPALARTACGQIGVYVSEAVVDLYGVPRPGVARAFQGFYACSARPSSAGSYVFHSRRVARLCAPDRAITPTAPPTSA